ncbi:MAG: hypothetical protein ACOC2M_00735 [bacterium]
MNFDPIKYAVIYANVYEFFNKYDEIDFDLFKGMPENTLIPENYDTTKKAEEYDNLKKELNKFLSKRWEMENKAGNVVSFQHFIDCEKEKLKEFDYHNILKEPIIVAYQYLLEEKENQNTAPIVPVEEEKTEKLINSLNTYNFESYLKKKNYDLHKIKELIKTYADSRSKLPFIIALLHVTSYEDYFFNEFAQNQKDGLKKLSKILGATERKIKGNINVLKNGSNEDPTQYQSHKFIEEIKRNLKKDE